MFFLRYEISVCRAYLQKIASLISFSRMKEPDMQGLEVTCLFSTVLSQNWGKNIAKVVDSDIDRSSPNFRRSGLIFRIAGTLYLSKWH